MDKQSVTNALSGVLALHTGRAGGVGAGSTLDTQLPAVPLDPKGLL